MSLCREILSRFIMDRFPTVVEGIVSDAVICREVSTSDLRLACTPRVPTDLENLELSGNFVNLEMPGKSQGI